MVHRKLLEILSRLGRDEHKRLRKFLHSPYFDQDRNPEELANLYDYIMEKGADEQNPALSKEEVFKHFFPGKVFRAKEKTALDTIASALFAQVKRYLTQSLLEKESGETKENIALLQFYNIHGLEDRFENTLKAARKTLNANPYRNHQHYFNESKLELEAMQFQLLYNRLEDDANMMAYSRSQDTYFVLSKLDFACSYFNLQGQVQRQFFLDAPILKAAQQLSETAAFLEIPLIQIYTLILDLLLAKKELQAGHLIQLENLCEKYKDQIDADVLKELKSYSRILSTRAYLKSGKDADRQQLFELYQKHYEEKSFFSNGMILAPALKNLITFGLKLQQFDWAQRILEDNPPEKIYGTRFPQDVYNVCAAQYHFNKKEYDTALEKLTYRHFENPHLGIFSDVILVQIYYETKNELVEYRLKALEQKVRRTKLSPAVKSRYYNFVKSLEKIIKYSWERDVRKTDKIRQEIISTPSIIEREWLLEKLAW